jgi:5-hydroxyisourate hydrolase-like protein (transthyretin family)
MFKCIASLLSLTTIAGAACLGAPQLPARESRETGSMSGRLTIGTDPAAGVTVLLYRQGSMRNVVARTTTDSDGRYSLSLLRGGGYRVMVLAPGYVISGLSGSGRSDLINLKEGEALTGVDFTLSRGGVITGRITDADGYPLIREVVWLSPENSRFSWTLSSGWSHITDDLGVYRLYGVPAGRYKVGVGELRDRDGNKIIGGESKQPGTFYPGVTEETQAVIVEVQEGEEITGIDIRAARPERSYSASGSVISEETGIGVPKATCEVTVVSSEGATTDVFGSSVETDSNGQFQLKQLPPDRYAVVASAPDHYSERVFFQIDQENVTGLDLRLLRGAIIAGTVALEGGGPMTPFKHLAQFTIGAMWESGGSSSTIQEDGRFELRGLPPGRLGLAIFRRPDAKFRPFIHRIEYNGQLVTEGIDVGVAQQLSGVRVVLTQGDVLQGQVKVAGAPIERIRFGLMIAQNLSQGPSFKIAVDSRGRFFAENVPAGTYELSLTSFLAASLSGDSAAKKLPEVKQVVTVREGIGADVTLIVDLNAASNP